MHTNGILFPAAFALLFLRTFTPPLPAKAQPMRDTLDARQQSLVSIAVRTAL